MARRDTNPNFVEAVARGLDLIRAFEPGRAGDVPRRARQGRRAAAPHGVANPCTRRRSLLRDVRETKGRIDMSRCGRSSSGRHTRPAGPHCSDEARLRSRELGVARTGESSLIAELDGF